MLIAIVKTIGIIMKIYMTIPYLWVAQAVGKLHMEGQLVSKTSRIPGVPIANFLGVRFSTRV